mgnify:CR=1 FL=1
MIKKIKEDNLLIQKKCPLCSAKMNKINGVLTCPDCGYNESFNRSSYTTLKIIIRIRAVLIVCLIDVFAVC